MWEKFRNARKVDILDMDSNVRLVQEPPGEIDIEKYRQEICYLSFVTHGRGGPGGNFENYGGNITGNYGENCQVWHTENKCPWITESKYTYYSGHNYSEIDDLYNCELKIAKGDPEIGLFPENCMHGPGWKGTVNTSVEEGRYIIYWASLVKHQSCVKSVILIDKKTRKSKDFITTRSDENFPIEYAKTICDMKIFIRGHLKCYSVETKVRCASDETGSSVFLGIVIAAILVVLSIVTVVVLIRRKSRVVSARENSRQEEELNDLYGTYFHGVEYNVVEDNNPRYNEDSNARYNEGEAGKDGAVVTDANAYYGV